MSNQSNDTQICSYYLKNMCKYGQTCYKIHPCEHFLKGCCKMPSGTCKFPHMTLKSLNALRVPKKEQVVIKPVQPVVEAPKPAPVTYGPPLPVAPLTLSFRDKLAGNTIATQPQAQVEQAQVEQVQDEDEEFDDEQAQEEEFDDENSKEEDDTTGFTSVKEKFKSVTHHVPKFKHIVCRYFLMLNPVTQHHNCKYGISGVNDCGHCPNLHPCYHYYTTGKCNKPKGSCKYPHVAKQK